jgi:hypothetical protein
MRNLSGVNAMYGRIKFVYVHVLGYKYYTKNIYWEYKGRIFNCLNNGWQESLFLAFIIIMSSIWNFCPHICQVWGMFLQPLSVCVCELEELKFPPCLIKQNVWGSEGTALNVLKITIRLRLIIGFMLQLLYPCTYCIRGCVGSRSSQDTIENGKGLCFYWGLNHNSLVMHIIAYWLYWLRYSDTCYSYSLSLCIDDPLPLCC